MIRTIHRAKFVLPEADLLLQNAAIHVTDPGRISRVEPWTGPPANLEVEVIDWGSAVILPGLVNAHTHLELTRLHRQITKFSSFTDWISQLVERRRLWTREEILESALDGARMSLASGSTLVGDIASSDTSWQALKRERLRAVVYEEVLSFLPERAGEVLDALMDRRRGVEGADLLTRGVSPHAPYSVSPELYRAVANLAKRENLPLAAHIAETRSELEFLQYGAGEFRALLSRLGAFPDHWRPPGLSPIGYLDSLGILERPALLIHCNYLDEDSMSRILRSHSSVAFCPRSHAFFGHSTHPVRALLDLGINVALGTDSLASNDTFSILDEMRYLYSNRKDLRTDELFRMATLNGAAALGFSNTLGRLRRGYWADMAVLEVPESMAPRNLTSQVLEGAGEIRATIVKGEVCWRRN